MSETGAKPLDQAQQRAIFSACDSTFYGLRTRVVLELAIRFGFKEKEITNLNLSHVTTHSKTWKKRSPAKKLIVPDSDEHTPMVDTDEQFRNVLLDYLRERLEFIESDPELIEPYSPLIVSQNMGRLTDRALRKSLLQTAEKANLKRITFHTLRATFIHGVWKQTKDVQEVAKRGRLKSAATVIRHIGVTAES